MVRRTNKVSLDLDVSLYLYPCLSVCLLQNEFLINAGDFGVIASVSGMSNVSHHKSWLSPSFVGKHIGVKELCCTLL